MLVSGTYSSCLALSGALAAKLAALDDSSSDEEHVDPESGNRFFLNTMTRVSSWEHPLDKYFKNLLWKERKNYKERAKQGHRPAQNGADVTTKAQDLYLKAQLEEKEGQLLGRL